MAKVQNQKSQVVSSKEMNEMDYLNDVLQCEKNIFQKGWYSLETAEEAKIKKELNSMKNLYKEL